MLKLMAGVWKAIHNDKKPSLFISDEPSLTINYLCQCANLKNLSSKNEFEWWAYLIWKRMFLKKHTHARNGQKHIYLRAGVQTTSRIESLNAQIKRSDIHHLLWKTSWLQSLKWMQAMNLKFYIQSTNWPQCSRSSYIVKSRDALDLDHYREVILDKEMFL